MRQIQIFVTFIFLVLLTIIWIKLRPEKNDSEIFVADFPNQSLLQITRIGFLLMGSGKYIQLVDQLIKSMDKHFCTQKDHIHVHYFIFTDNLEFKHAIIQLKRNYSIIQ